MNQDKKQIKKEEKNESSYLLDGKWVICATHAYNSGLSNITKCIHVLKFRAQVPRKISCHMCGCINLLNPNKKERNTEWCYQTCVVGSLLTLKMSFIILQPIHNRIYCDNRLIGCARALLRASVAMIVSSMVLLSDKINFKLNTYSASCLHVVSNFVIWRNNTTKLSMNTILFRRKCVKRMNVCGDEYVDYHAGRWGISVHVTTFLFSLACRVFFLLWENV